MKKRTKRGLIKKHLELQKINERKEPKSEKKEVKKVRDSEGLTQGPSLEAPTSIFKSYTENFVFEPGSKDDEVLIAQNQLGAMFQPHEPFIQQRISCGGGMEEKTQIVVRAAHLQGNTIADRIQKLT